MERVCKTWRTLVDDSKKITRSRCLTPVQTFSEPGQRDGLEHPVYAAGENIRLHPALNARDTHMVGCRETDRTFNASSFMIVGNESDDAVRALMQIAKHQYLASPPISALKIWVFFDDKGDEDSLFCTRILEASEGVRIGDMQIMVDGIIGNSKREAGPDDISGICLVKRESL